MDRDDRWLLPEGIDELLPPDTWRLEQLRRTLLDLYDSWGYELVMPPFIEFLDSLLVGTGRDLELQTFKLIDQLSGRTLGVRADMTPQVARIDAHRLKQPNPTRLCYMGTVLHTRGDGFGGSRVPLQIGAELYGHSGFESDLEILLLMLATLNSAAVAPIYLDLGHVAVFRELVRQVGLNPEQEARLFELLQRKALPELDILLAELSLSSTQTNMLRALARLHGDPSVLDDAGRLLASASDDVGHALTTLSHISDGIHVRYPDMPIHIDLAELRGYHYHTGVVFAAYIPGQGQEIARGGRYDQIGQAFGRARPATGFSTDLKTLLVLGNHSDKRRPAIYAPATDDPSLKHAIIDLRARRERVIQALPGVHTSPDSLGCNRILVKNEQSWQIEFLTTAAEANILS